MIVALLLALATAPLSFSPARPTVGDAITMKASGSSFEVRPSAEFEVVSASSSEVVIRTFRPGPLQVEYVTHAPGEIAATGTLQIDVVSVLARDDKLEPAPLRPPKPLPRNDRVWWIATGVAAAFAIALWCLLALLLRLRTATAVPGPPRIEDPEAAFRAALASVRQLRDDESQWVALSSATRRYLAATDSFLGVELTSFELLTAMRNTRRRERDLATVEAILRGGDWTKFSPFGAPRLGIEELLDEAVALIPRRAAAEVAA